MSEWGPAAGVAERGFSELLADAPVAYLLVGFEGATARVLAGNRAASEVLGYEELVGLDLLSILDPEDLPPATDAFPALLDGRLDVVARRRVYRRADGGRVVVDALGFVVGRGARGTLVLAALSVPERTRWMLQRLRIDVEATSALSELRAALLAGVGGDELLTRICESTRILLAADNAGVLRLDGTDHVELVALLDQRNHRTGKRWPIVDDDYGRALRESRVASFEIPGATVAAAGDPTAEPTHVAMAPLVSGDRMLGSLMVQRSGSAFTDEDLGRLGTYAKGVGEALTVAESRVELERLRVLEAVGRDLHDEVIQDLIAVRLGLVGLREAKMDAPAHRRVDELLDEVDRATRQLRDVVRGLHASAEPGGFEEVVTSLARRRAERIEMGWSVELDAEAIRRLGVATRVDALAVLNEALSNALRHSDGTEVEVRMTLEDRRVVLVVSDDGVGFRTDAVAEGRGLVNLRRRAEAWGGGCRVESTPGQGTRVVWWVPVARPDEGSDDGLPRESS